MKLELFVLSGRQEQCEVFNGNNFNIEGLPPFIKWVPKTAGSKLPRISLSLILKIGSLSLCLVEWQISVPLSNQKIVKNFPF
jgi:hypothetical protein